MRQMNLLHHAWYIAVTPLPTLYYGPRVYREVVFKVLRSLRQYFYEKGPQLLTKRSLIFRSCVTVREMPNT